MSKEVFFQPQSRSGPACGGIAAQCRFVSDSNDLLALIATAINFLLVTFTHQGELVVHPLRFFECAPPYPQVRAVDMFKLVIRPVKG